MTVLFHDVHQEVDYKIVQFTGDCTNIWELLYADDTMVMGNRAREINIICGSGIKFSSTGSNRVRRTSSAGN